MKKYFNSVANELGQPVAGASVTVVTYPGGSLATIYSDAGITPIPNPLTTNGNGAFSFYAADGHYSLQISSPNFAPQTVTDILLQDVTDGAIQASLSSLVVSTSSTLPANTTIGGQPPGTGTVSSVTVVGTSGLTGSGTITTSGTIDLSLAPVASGTILAGPASGADAAPTPQTPAALGLATSASLATSGGASSIGYESSASGAVLRTVASKLAESVSVLDFDGADPTGVTDSTAAIQAALNSGALSVNLGSGRFLISNTLSVPANTLFFTNAPEGNGPAIGLVCATGMNVPAVSLAQGAEIRNVTLYGSATSSTTGAHGVYINGINGATISGCFLTDFYNLVEIDGSSFYATIKDCIFYNAVAGQLNINSSTAAGVDLFIESSRFLNSSGTNCISASGLGSLIMSDVQMSALNITSYAIYISSVATGFGGILATNCVVEQPSTAGTASCVYINCTYATPAVQCYWENVNFVTASGASVFVAAYMTDSLFSNCEFSNSSTGTCYGFYIAGYGDVSAQFSNCRFDGSAGLVPFGCTNPSTIDLDISNTRWQGSTPFIDFSANTGGSIPNLSVTGGLIGTAAIPILLPPNTIVPGKRSFYRGAQSTSPSYVWAQTEGGAFKQFDFYTNGYVNNSTTNTVIPFAAPFVDTPAISVNTTGLTVSASTTALTITAPNNTTSYSGVITIIGP